ncbi:MAG: alpha-glucosidase C-terminal domain-containing protein [Phycisphaeraceae bacterium]|nr:MAG: alpha-glucosidase C-terminal domain-containing protein [Phycisphaeraceae bacterium]
MSWMWAIRSVVLAACIAAESAWGQATVNPAASPDARIVVSNEDRSGEPVNLDAWWNHAVFYQVFVRSFADSSSGPLAGDGIGDFQGLIERLDYLNDGDPATTRDLGVTALWLMPIMPATGYHGYDVKDYTAVNPEHGTMEDFTRLVRECERRGIRVILDWVPNHCSWEHPWFVEAMDPNGSTRDWFLWSSERPRWKGAWNQEVWHPHPARGSSGGYYFGLFWKGMPDFNLRNPEATAALFASASFWLRPEVGVSGFRIDAVRHLIEDGEVQESTPETHAWLAAFRRHAESVRPDAFTVGEVWAESGQVAPYVGRGLRSAFEFDTAEATIRALNTGAREGLDRQWGRNLRLYPRGQYSTFLSNHDLDRVMSRLGGGDKSTRETGEAAWRKARAAATILFTAPGVPFIYNGEEIGMVGVKPDEDIRTPMPWDAGGGFTAGTPWRAYNADTPGKNVAVQDADPSSLLNHYRSLIRLRTNERALRVGSMEVLDTANRRVWAFAREDRGRVIVVAVNLSGEPVADYLVTVPASVTARRRGVDLLTGREVGVSRGDARFKPAEVLGAYGSVVVGFGEE